jgi:hypothetical protein
MGAFWRKLPLWGLAPVLVLLIGCQNLAVSQNPTASPVATVPQAPVASLTPAVAQTRAATPTLLALSTDLFAPLQGTSVVLGSAPTPTLAPSTGSNTIPTTVEQVPRITPQKLKERLDAGESIVIVDARPLDSYNQRHIVGSVSIPLDEIDRRHDELPKDKDITLYCT